MALITGIAQSDSRVAREPLATRAANRKPSKLALERLLVRS
jgi:hypothetical protein